MSFSANATHIMGGEIYYEYLDSAKYRITMFFYVDCINGNSGAIELDKEAIFGFFNAKSNELISVVSVVRSSPVLVTELNYECVTNKPNACVHKYQYTQDVSIDPGTDGVIIAFQRCCRNKTIDNIFDPEATGMTLFANIPPKGIVNSNPVFKKLPPNFLCNDAPLIFDHSATDLDGDSLVYELFTPFVGASSSSPRPSSPSKPPYQRILFVSPYFEGNMMAGSEKLKIDSKTGKLTVKPSTTGQYVVGVKVSEYRNGVKIGETLRDYQFNVLPCQLTTKANFTFPEITCDMRSIPFKNLSDSAKSFMWDFGITGSALDTSTSESPNFTYPGKGKYVVKLKVANKNCLDSISRTIDIGLVDSIFARFEVFPDTLCLGSNIQLKNNSTATKHWQWDMGDNLGFYYNSNPVEYEYDLPGDFVITLTISDSANCNNSDTATKLIHVVKPTTHKTDFGYLIADDCSPLVVELDRLTELNNKWLWIIDEDTLSDKLKLNHEFEVFGAHRIQLINIDSNPHCAKYIKKDSVIYIEDNRNLFRDLIIPNIFSPNGDDLNDCYQLGGTIENCLTVKILIFSRWGECLFNSEVDGYCWDGINPKTGLLYPEGTYFGLIDVFDDMGKAVFRHSNTINLVR